MRNEKSLLLTKFRGADRRVWHQCIVTGDINTTSQGMFNKNVLGELLSSLTRVSWNLNYPGVLENYHSFHKLLNISQVFPLSTVSSYSSLKNRRYLAKKRIKLSSKKPLHCEPVRKFRKWHLIFPWSLTALSSLVTHILPLTSGHDKPWPKDIQ